MFHHYWAAMYSLEGIVHVFVVGLIALIFFQRRRVQRDRLRYGEEHCHRVTVGETVLALMIITMGALMYPLIIPLGLVAWFVWLITVLCNPQKPQQISELSARRLPESCPPELVNTKDWERIK